MLRSVPCTRFEVASLSIRFRGHETYYPGSGGKGLHECSLDVRVGDKFVVKQKRGDRGTALRLLRVIDDERGHLGHLQREQVTLVWPLTEKVEV